MSQPNEPKDMTTLTPIVDGKNYYSAEKSPNGNCFVRVRVELVTPDGRLGHGHEFRMSGATLGGPSRARTVGVQVTLRECVHPENALMLFNNMIKTVESIQKVVE